MIQLLQDVIRRYLFFYIVKQIITFYEYQNIIMDKEILHNVPSAAQEKKERVMTNKSLYSLEIFTDNA